MRPFLKALMLCALIASLMPPAWAEDTGTVETRREALVQKLLAQGFDEAEARAVLEDKRVALYPEIIGKTGKGIDYFARKFDSPRCKRAYSYILIAA